MSGEIPLWLQIITRLPFVCPRCSRRFPREPRNSHCPNHLPHTKIKVLDQTDLGVRDG